MGINTSITALCLVSKSFSCVRVFSLQIRCSGLHFENCLLQIKHLCRYASDKHMYLCTQRCVHIFSQTNVHMMPAPRSLHLPTACACSAAQLRCRRGLAAPDHAGDLPGKVNPRCHTGCGARLPAPTGPRAARPTPTQAARSTGGGGGAASAPEAPPSARGSFFIFKRLRRTRPAPRAAAAGGSERSEAEEAPPPRRRLPASAAPLPRRPLPRAPARRRPLGFVLLRGRRCRGPRELICAWLVPIPLSPVLSV